MPPPRAHEPRDAIRRRQRPASGGGSAAPTSMAPACRWRWPNEGNARTPAREGPGRAADPRARRGRAATRRTHRGGRSCERPRRDGPQCAAVGPGAALSSASATRRVALARAPEQPVEPHASTPDDGRNVAAVEPLDEAATSAARSGRPSGRPRRRRIATPERGRPLADEALGPRPLALRATRRSAARQRRARGDAAPIARCRRRSPRPASAPPARDRPGSPAARIRAAAPVQVAEGGAQQLGGRAGRRSGGDSRCLPMAPWCGLVWSGAVY